MKTTFAFVFAGVIAVGAFIPALAQNYHYNYGGSRVVRQNQTGLNQPSGSYIGSGTLSQSAQGKQAGVGGALPTVTMGGHVRTPGDNMYNNEGTNRMSNGALIYQDQANAMTSQRMARYQQLQRQAQMQQLQQRRMQGHFYVPGSNGAAATYGNAPTSEIQYSRSGAATYGGFSDKGSSTRQF